MFAGGGGGGEGGVQCVHICEEARERSQVSPSGMLFTYLEIVSLMGLELPNWARVASH